MRAKQYRKQSRGLPTSWARPGLKMSDGELLLCGSASPGVDAAPESGPQVLSPRDIEAFELFQALKRTRGNVAAAAEELGISRAKAYRLMRRVPGVEPEALCSKLRPLPGSAGSPVEEPGDAVAASVLESAVVAATISEFPPAETTLVGLDALSFLSRSA